MSSLRQRWTNLILHTSALIYRQKESLLTAHALSAFFTVFSIIGAEVFLTVVSLPSYLVTTSEAYGSTGEEVQYKTRRALTLSLLIGILILWAIKMIFILGLSFAANPSEYRIRETGTKTTTLDTLAPHVIAAAVDPALPVPAILSVAQNKTDSAVLVQGKAVPGAWIMVYMAHAASAKPNQQMLKMYTGQAALDGAWTVEEDRNVFSMPAGEYQLTAVNFDGERHVKSNPSSPPVNFTVRDPWFQALFHRLDFILNLLAILFISVGLLALVLVL